MKFYGHANLQNNQIQAAVMETEVNFPDNPTVGRLIFKDKRVYICVSVTAGLPVWVPMTNVIDTYVHYQTSASSTWSVNHKLFTATPVVQVWDTDNKTMFPDEVTVVDNQNLTVTFASPVAGACTVIMGSIEGGDPPSYAFEYMQTSLASVWTVNHNLGYYPVVRVFIGNEEVQPASIVHDSVNQTTITFNSAYVGIAEFA
jgi:hypothetical protein